MEDEKFFESLDKIPELIERVDKLSDAVAKNNEVTTGNVATISSTVLGQNERLKVVETQLMTLTNSIDSAKAQMQKEVIVQVEPADVHITQKIPGWVEDMGKEYNDLKRQALSRKERKVITIGPKFFMYIAMLACAVLAGWVLLFFYWEYKRNNSAEAYAERAYNAALANDYRNPGGYYANIRELYNNGEIEDAKNSVGFWEQAAKNRDYFKNVLSPLYDNQRIIIEAYSSKNKEAVVWWRLYDDDKDMVSHIQKDGKIIVADADKLKIESIEDAHKYSRSKHWRVIREATHTVQTE